MSCIKIPYNDLTVVISSHIRRVDDDKRSDSRNIVFLHGGGCAKESFNHAWSHSALKHHSLYAFDLAGHGSSTKSDLLSYTVHEQANLMMRALDSLELGNVDIVGHSLGGVVATVMVTAEPLRYRTFTDIEGILLREGGSLFGDGFLEADYEMFKERLFPQFRKQMASDGHTLWARWLGRCDPRAFYAGARSMVDLQKDGNLFEIYAALPVEKHFVYGAHTPPKMVDALDGIGRCHAIPDSDHFPMLENCGEFYDVIAKIVLSKD